MESKTRLSNSNKCHHLFVEGVKGKVNVLISQLRMAKIVEWVEKLNGTSIKKDDINEDLFNIKYVNKFKLICGLKINVCFEGLS